ncbi:LemA family protein [Photorhabdus sp. SF281]|uniref:LemA family protein n=1 Tax=Photorhabdus sp. SF281 TaxID=3459527 RepID=UPI0040448C2D
MDKYILSFLILAIILLVTVRYLLGIFNKIVMLKKYRDKAFANIDVLLKKQADLIPQLITIAEQAMIHEKSFFLQLSAVRKNYLGTKIIDEKVKIGNALEHQLSLLLMLAENYPTLISQPTFQHLQAQITLLENQIADRREFFNKSVALYNMGIKQFPNIIFARILRYKPSSMLKPMQG